MDVREAVLKRRSIRKYTEEQISEEDLLTILEAGLNAPSASNYQPWYFVAVRSPEKMRELLDIMNGVARDHEPLITERFRKHPEVAREVHGFLQTLGGAKTCIIVFRYKEEYLNSGEDIIEHSLGAAIENMLLQAQELGIGSCWVAAPSETGADEGQNPATLKVLVFSAKAVPAKEAKSVDDRALNDPDNGVVRK